jgi:hypothetical protein
MRLPPKVNVRLSHYRLREYIRRRNARANKGLKCNVKLASIVRSCGKVSIGIKHVASDMACQKGSLNGSTKTSNYCEVTRVRILPPFRSWHNVIWQKEIILDSEVRLSI